MIRKITKAKKLTSKTKRPIMENVKHGFHRSMWCEKYNKFHPQTPRKCE